MSNPLATARQLWRLNKDGKLALVESGTPIPVVVADAAIKDCSGVVEGGVVGPHEGHLGGTSEAH